MMRPDSLILWIASSLPILAMTVKLRHCDRERSVAGSNPARDGSSHSTLQKIPQANIDAINARMKRGASLRARLS
jgi:hypothetical protein